MKQVSVGKVLVYFILAFVIIAIWRDPQGAATATANFLGSVGSFFSTLLDKVNTFIQGL